MLEFFKQELWLIPNWAWFAIVLGVACLLIAIIIIACKKGGKAKDESVEVKQAEEKQEPVKQEVAEAKAEEPVKQEVKEEKPAEKKSTSTKTTTAKSTTGKTTAKSTSTKTTAAKSTTAKKEEEKPAAKEESSSSETKVYHISKRKEDKKWQVKAEGADKALRLFFTQTDAIEYAKKVAGNQDGRIVIHKEGGGFRKLNY